MAETEYQRHRSVDSWSSKGDTSLSKVWRAIRRFSGGQRHCGILLDEDESFGALMEQCAMIEARANARAPEDRP